jgi:hypothetical protein
MVNRTRTQADMLSGGVGGWGEGADQPTRCTPVVVGAAEVDTLPDASPFRMSASSLRLSQMRACCHHSPAIHIRPALPVPETWYAYRLDGDCKCCSPGILSRPSPCSPPSSFQAITYPHHPTARRLQPSPATLLPPPPDSCTLPMPWAP